MIIEINMNEIQKAFLNGEKVRCETWERGVYKTLNVKTFEICNSNGGSIGFDIKYYLQSMKENPESWELYQEKLQRLEFDSTDPALPQIRDKINEIVDILNEVKE